MIIRQAVITDAEKLRELSISTFCNAYEKFNTETDMKMYVEKNFSPENIHLELSDPVNVFFVVEENKELMAYLKLALFPKENNVNAEKPIEILRFYTSVGHAGKGIGKLLFDHCVSFATERGYDKIQLGVWQKNEGAIAVYKKWNFKITGSVKFIFGTDVQDDFIMEYEIVPWSLRTG
ncbi:MAG: GNAT family N-acetyltransferase [Bacteroidetes bacterium]|nr:GNAT family N-acetyltransferase [Bacteroidota bacterium]